jgi:hypothetical protein
MTFTGTLIDDLMEAVERVELKAQPNDAFVCDASADPSAVEPWFASVQESNEYDSKFLGVA